MLFFKTYEIMENKLNVDFTTQFPVEGVVSFFALIVLIGCACYFGWKMRGLTIYVGVLVTLMGLLLVYMGITDSIEIVEAD